MTQRLRICLVLVLAGSVPALAQTSRRIDPDQLMRVVRELASPPYQGRRTGTEGGNRARAFIRGELTRLGLQPAGMQGFDQPFRYDSTNGANLVAKVAGTRPGARTLVVTAHFDHLGVRTGTLHPGADDNASGVAALLAIAQYVKAHPLTHPVLFVALDAEEQGLRGAKAFLERPPVPIAQMALNINLDMVSRNDRNEIFAAGTYHAPWLKPIVEGVQRRAAVTIRFGHDLPGTGDDDWTLQSDHGEFHKARVPFLYFGVEDHPDYHKPGDTADRINPAFFARVVGTLLDALLAIDAQVDAANPGP